MDGMGVRSRAPTENLRGSRRGLLGLLGVAGTVKVAVRVWGRRRWGC